MKKFPQLCFSETVHPGMVFGLSRHTFKSRGGFYLHGHKDFAEVFWVEEGSGWHLVNGTSRPLQRGSLVMVRQKDVHAFKARKGEQFTMVNISFPLSTLKFWRKRYFARRAIFFWSQAPCPHEQVVDVSHLRRLGKWTAYLSTCPNQYFHLDRFMMDLFHTLQPEGGWEDRFNGLPERLTQAIRQMQEPMHLTEGVHRLAKLAGCSLQHLNRILNKHLGQTAGEIILQSRLQGAARQLQLSDSKIVDISLDCGFNNLGHFYQQFNKQYGMTPRQYRLRQQLVIGGQRGGSH